MEGEGLGSVCEISIGLSLKFDIIITDNIIWRVGGMEGELILIIPKEHCFHIQYII